MNNIIYRIVVTLVVAVVGLWLLLSSEPTPSAAPKPVTPAPSQPGKSFNL